MQLLIALRIIHEWRKPTQLICPHCFWGFASRWNRSPSPFVAAVAGQELTCWALYWLSSLSIKTINNTLWSSFLKIMLPPASVPLDFAVLELVVVWKWWFGGRWKPGKISRLWPTGGTCFHAVPWQMICFLLVLCSCFLSSVFQAHTRWAWCLSREQQEAPSVRKSMSFVLSTSRNWAGINNLGGKTVKTGVREVCLCLALF